MQGMERRWLGGDQLGAAITWVNLDHVAMVQVVDDLEVEGVLVVATLANGTDVYLARFPDRSTAVSHVEDRLEAHVNG